MTNTRKPRTSTQNLSIVSAPRQKRRSKNGDAPVTSSSRDGSASRATTSWSLSAAEIAAEAYAIYKERGGTHGRDLDDWLEAERRLSARATVSVDR